MMRRFFHGSRVARGALTSKPYAFVARPWELENTEGVDNTGSLGANIRIQARGNEVLRILPKINDDVNEEWIDDKTRFSYDGLKVQRLLKPLVRDVTNPNAWSKDLADWRDAFGRIKAAVKMFTSDKIKVRGITGNSTDLYSILALSDLIENLGGDNVVLEHVGGIPSLNADLPAQYRFNSQIVGFEESDLCVLIGTNLNTDAPLLVARMRGQFLNDSLRVVQIGARNELTFPAEQIGLTPVTLKQILEGSHSFSADLKAAKKPMFIVDSSVFEREDGKAIAKLVYDIALRPEFKVVQNNWNGLNFFHRNSNDVGLLELGRTAPFSAAVKQSDILYLMQVQAADLLNVSADVQKLRESSKFIVYQGSHGDELAAIADVVLPGAAFTEKTGIYTSVEGRSQRSRNAIAPPALARSDWEIIRALSEVLGVQLPYNNAAQIHDRLEMFVPSVGKYEEKEITSLNSVHKIDFMPDGLSKVVDALTKEAYEKGVDATPMKPAQYDFYLQGHPIARASRVMARCSQRYLPNTSSFEHFY